MAGKPDIDDPYLFLICEIGDEGSLERTRADEVYDYIVAPAAKAKHLKVIRSDKEPSPGRITIRILTRILQAHVVVADLTGRNPNVYFELGVAQSFNRPVVLLVDDVDSLSFDVKDEAAIEIGDSGGEIGARRADTARNKLQESLDVVLKEGYDPESLVVQVATAKRLDDLAPTDPYAAQLSEMRARLDLLVDLVRTQGETARAPGAFSSLIGQAATPQYGRTVEASVLGLSALGASPQGQGALRLNPSDVGPVRESSIVISRSDQPPPHLSSPPPAEKSRAAKAPVKRAATKKAQPKKKG